MEVRHRLGALRHNEDRALIYPKSALVLDGEPTGGRS
jgi:hypothetical protein